jgi:hypothetical protein
VIPEDVTNDPTWNSLIAIPLWIEMSRLTQDLEDPHSCSFVMAEGAIRLHRLGGEEIFPTESADSTAPDYLGAKSLC